MKLIEDINNSEGLYSLTWSASQDAFHTEKLSIALNRGVRACINNRSSQGYIMVFIGSMKDVSAMADELRKRKIRPKPESKIPPIPDQPSQKKNTKPINKKNTPSVKKPDQTKSPSKGKCGRKKR